MAYGAILRCPRTDQDVVVILSPCESPGGLAVVIDGNDAGRTVTLVGPGETTWDALTVYIDENVSLMPGDTITWLQGPEAGSSRYFTVYYRRPGAGLPVAMATWGVYRGHGRTDLPENAAEWAGMGRKQRRTVIGRGE